MIRGVYQAGAAMQMAAQNQELLAENLAQATTPGYRRQGMTFQAILAGNESNPNNAAQISDGGPFTSFEPGPMQQTGATYDLALNGDGFFVVDGPNGPLYTRNGNFEVNAQGELQTHNGLRVHGAGGSIVIPENTLQIRVTRDGSVMADGTEVGKLDIAQFDNPRELHRAGTTFFAGGSPKTPEPGKVNVEQGFREGSNVQVVEEMVSMMLGMRQYEAAQRALHALSEAMGLNTHPQ